MAYTHLKRYLTSLTIREMQIKTIRYGKMKHLDIEDMEKLEHFHTIGGNAKWCSYYGKQYGSSLKN